MTGLNRMALQAFILAMALAAGPVPDEAATVRATMREALREAAPPPSGRPVLPEGALRGGQMTDATRAMKRDAERMAIERAKRGAAQAGRAGSGGATHNGTTGESMHGDREGSDPSCDPAGMMRSRGMMPGGDHTVPDSGPQHRGM